MHLSGLFIHPVKSLRGCAVPAADVDALGLVGDRRFMVVDAAGRFLTQRTLPRMALIETDLGPEALILSVPGQGGVSVPLHAPRDSRPTVAVTVWGSTGLATEDCGEAAAAWLGYFLGTPCLLVRIGGAFHRPLLKPGKALPGDLPSFADSYPFLVIGEASLADLNDRLAGQGGEALPMNRFRPNLVVAGAAAFAEDTWTGVRIGSLVFRAGGPCARCVVTTTDQATAERGPEPLRTLARYRRDTADPTNVNFGQNLIHETKTGTLRLGDPVEPAG